MVLWAGRGNCVCGKPRRSRTEAAVRVSAFVRLSARLQGGCLVAALPCIPTVGNSTRAPLGGIQSGGSPSGFDTADAVGAKLLFDDPPQTPEPGLPIPPSGLQDR